MSSISLCSKGLIFVLWSELVLEGFQCLFEFINSLNSSSKHGSKISKVTSHSENLETKRAKFPSSDALFTRVLFFPDHTAIAGMLCRNYTEKRQLSDPRAAPGSNHENKNVSHALNGSQNHFYPTCYTPHKNQPNFINHSNSGTIPTFNNYNTPEGHIQIEGCVTDSTSTSSRDASDGYHPGSSQGNRGALEELVLCLDGAVTSIDVCVLLLTCDRIIAPLLRAKVRGVRVRVLLDRSMATVEGSSLPQLRKCNIPVRLLPRTSNNNNNSSSANYNNSNNNNSAHTSHRDGHKSNATFPRNNDNSSNFNKSTFQTTHRNVAAFQRDSWLDQKPEVKEFDIVRDNGGGVPGSFSGLMHHKFAVIDALEKNVSKDDNAGEQRNESYVLIRDRGRGNLKQLDSNERGRRIVARVSLPEDEVRNVRPLVITGSFNWTWSAVTNNSENLIISNRPELVAPFCEQFDQLWLQAC